MEKNVNVEPTTVNKGTFWEIINVQVSSLIFRCFLFFSYILFVQLCFFFLVDGSSVGFWRRIGELISKCGGSIKALEDVS